MDFEMLICILLGVVIVLIISVFIIIMSNRGLNREVDSLTKSYLRLEGQNEVKNEAVTTLLKELGESLKETQKSNQEQIDNRLKSQKDDLTLQFNSIEERLENMYKNLGEVRDLATGVNDLKKILANVKTRGNLGEYQLKAILEEILTSDQYIENCETVPGSNKRVEFAIKLPGNGDGVVLLPIDSKFPGDTYQRYRDAYATGDKDLIEQAWKVLEKTIRDEAKDIFEKYISVPYTTEFGLMFLPFEGLYVEVVDHGMLEELQTKYHVTISGPSTLVAILNSFRMGFRTLQIEKHSNEIYELLGAVKTEFLNYAKALNDCKKSIRLADDKLEKLITTRTNVMVRKLKGIDTVDEIKAKEILELEDDLSEEEYEY